MCASQRCFYYLSFLVTKLFSHFNQAYLQPLPYTSIVSIVTPNNQKRIQRHLISDFSSKRGEPKVCFCCFATIYSISINANGGNSDFGTKAQLTTHCRCERVETKEMLTLMVFLVINDSLMFTLEPPFYLLVFQPSLLTRSSTESFFFPWPLKTSAKCLCQVSFHCIFQYQGKVR